MIELKKKNEITLKKKITNIIMKNGEKHTGEKILLKSSKLLQKLSKKKFKDLIQFSVINTTSAFKLNEQVIKKGKRKSKKITPSFIIKDYFRAITGVKYIKIAIEKGENFHKSFAKEILASSLLKSQSIEQKTKLQTKILLNKRYLSKFKW